MVAFLPHIMALDQKRELNRRVIFKVKEENGIMPDYEAEAIH
jgi:hypothetical protein